ncbi:hypothetical protein [Nitrosomonas sp.]|uniref:hypothetical protein n=1 Tax=Nitrosomonas sp. TaxID=42353 RepID=UPI001DF50AD0|nr:hypothetical protein [Nitrosomonas sp.]MCB1949618.1 hypothetical protein [Nitrosomonas sp.]MCP5242370.1 hypothetical protein [Burkholderiales bacterium]MDR4514632.1 hypothetical protein [Nitrosomonas sp.]
MKRIMTALALLFFTTSTAHAAGPFDGIYAFNFNGILTGYASIHENNGVIIAVVLEPSPSDSTWEAVRGTRNGNIVRLSSIFGTVDLVIDITFNGDNSTGTVVLISCTDNDNDPSNDSDNCDIPAGTTLGLTKIF